MPMPFFFMAAAFFLADADLAFLPAVFFAAVIFFSSAYKVQLYSQPLRTAVQAA